MTLHYWTCRRMEAGRMCLHRNTARRRKCEKCGGERKMRSRPKHLSALEADYQHYIKLNGGEFCGICLTTKKGGKRDRQGRLRTRFDRDHDHRLGRPRGLLCVRCNKALAAWMTPEWLRAAADYLERVPA